MMKQRQRWFTIAVFLVAALSASAGRISASDAARPAAMMPPYAAERPGDEQLLRSLSENSDKTLTVKEFAPDWVRSLDARGEPIVYTREDSADFDFIGMPVGGVCAGQTYLGGDGKLWCWDIFNTKGMRDVRGVPTHANPYRRSEPDTRAHHQVNQGFSLRIQQDGETVTRTLDRDGFQNIEFRGQYPIGTVKYADKDLPVQVELEAFSPFTPLDLEDSIYPATILHFTVTNTSNREVSGDLLGWLENAVCIKSRSGMAGQLINKVVRGDGRVMVTFCAAEPELAESSNLQREDVVFEDFEGALGNWKAEGDAFDGNPKPNFHQQPLRGHRGQGLADSFRNGGVSNAQAGPSDAAIGRLISKPFTIERKAIKFLIGGGKHDGQTCLNLVVDGKIVQSATGDNSETLRSQMFDTAGLQGKQAHLEIVDNHKTSWGHVLVDQIVFSDNAALDARPLGQLPDFGSMALTLVGDPSKAHATAAWQSGAEIDNGQTSSSVAFTAESPVGAIGCPFTLAPGQRQEVRFILSWYFPNAPQFPISTAQGRYYGAKFDSAADVGAKIAADFDRLAAQTRLWRDTWYDSTLPYWFLDRTFINTSTLATNTCYLFRDGRFYGYEGVYHGHGTCNHVWGYVQAPGRLFPVLERRLREMVDYNPAVSFFPDSGRIAQRSEARRDDAADGQSGCILRTYLVHQMQKDDSFLKGVYPQVKLAMNYLTNTYDQDRDGILTGPQFNTLDAAWYGKITWISLHYTAALRATAAMADEMGDRQYAGQCRQLADRGRSYIEEQLFNGEYFFHEADPEHPKSPGVYNGLEYSQLLGQSWAYQVGLGQIVDPAKATTHLKSLWKYNFTTDVGPFREQYQNGRWYAMPGEGGIIACTWPQGGDEALKLGHQHFAGYLNECQPGYEWAATSLYMWHGLPFHALAHTRTMHERYGGAKRNPWNEVEWGSHYSRSMASYGVFTAACGFEYNGPKGYIAFSPRITPEDFRAAFTSAEGWGTFAQQRTEAKQIETLELRWGNLTLKTLAFDLAADAVASSVTVSIGDQRLEARLSTHENRVVVDLLHPVTVETGQTLRVEVSSTRNENR